MEYYNQPWLNIVAYLTRTLGMSLFTKTDEYETYRKQLKNHIVTVTIKMDDYVEGPELVTNLTIDGSNTWWHIHPYHSEYVIESLDYFSEIDFVRVIIRHSIEFYDAWRGFAEL